LAPLREICHDCGYYRTPTGADPRQHPAWAAALEDLVEALACYRVEGAPIDASALYRAEAGQAAVTRTNREVPGSELTLGLHVDSWEGTPLRYRASVRNRLCINLGHEPRYLAFINLTLADVLRAVEPRDATDLEAISLFAGHEFMARCPHYPVTRLRLDPNELYIAPTGNMIHDGVAPEGVQPDVALHLLGFFAPPSMCAAAGREQYADGR
ncbi:MAG TPA: hypothetical protein VJR89_10875, partial [Polyangiales bacterium]|nr:hypothetical protein [Polyangiales bacterium]